MDEYVIPLDRARQAGAPHVGGKAAMLGALLEAGFPVPPGLCLTTTAFHLALDPWLERIDVILRQHDLHDPAGAVAASGLADGLLHDVEVPAPVIYML